MFNRGLFSGAGLTLLAFYILSLFFGVPTQANNISLLGVGAAIFFFAAVYVAPLLYDDEKL